MEHRILHESAGLDAPPFGRGASLNGGKRLKMKSIFLIGVGEIGLNQIHWARDAGFFVITSNLNPAATAMSLADVGVVLSGTDTRALVTYALECQGQYNISAVYSGNDFGVFSAAIISQALGIPVAPVAAVTRSLGKTLMKTCWIKSGVPTPDFKLVRTDRDAFEAIAEFGMPVIIKPADSSGSQGIQYVSDANELGSVLVEAFRYTKSNLVILEKWFDGRHIDANAFFWGNKFYACGMAERFFTPFPYRVPIGGYEPAILSQNEKTMLYRLFEKAARSLGINHGPVKADFILSKDGPQVIEISARFHGDVGTSHNSYYRAGISPLQVYFETLFTEQVPTSRLDEMLSSPRVSGWRVLDLPAGHVCNLVEAAREAKKSDGIDQVFVEPRAAGVISGLRNNNDVVGFVWSSGECREDVDTALDCFMDELRAKAVYR